MNKTNNPAKFTSRQETLTSPSYSTSATLKHFKTKIWFLLHWKSQFYFWLENYDKDNVCSTAG